MNKVSIIGAGMVGSTAARNIAQMDFVDEVVLVDIKPGFAEGKAMDINQAGFLLRYNTRVIGSTGNYTPVKDSDVIVITSGVPRKPGMTREELVGINSSIMQDIVAKCHEQAPNAIYVVVSNPVDTLAYYTAELLEKKFGRKDAKEVVVGFGGMLDDARLAYYISEADNKYNKVTRDRIYYVNSFVVGGHGDTTMVPVTDEMFIEEESQMVDQILPKSEIETAVQNAMKGGATLTGLLGTSAWEAPAAGIAVLCKAIILDNYDAPLCVSSWNEEYKLYIGQEKMIDHNGVRNVNGEYPVSVLSDSNKEKFAAAAAAIAKVNEALPEVK